MTRRSESVERIVESLILESGAFWVRPDGEVIDATKRGHAGTIHWINAFPGVSGISKIRKKGMEEGWIRGWFEEWEEEKSSYPSQPKGAVISIVPPTNSRLSSSQLKELAKRIQRSYPRYSFDQVRVATNSGWKEVDL